MNSFLRSFNKFTYNKAKYLVLEEKDKEDPNIYYKYYYHPDWSEEILFRETIGPSEALGFVGIIDFRFVKIVKETIIKIRYDDI